MSRRWLYRRIFTNILVLFAALVINFAIPRMMPGNPVDVFTSGVKLTREARDAIIARFGLDAPIYEQFVHYIVNCFKGDFGISFTYYPKTVWETVMQALPWTLFMMMTALLIAAVLGYFLGVIAGWKAGSRLDGILQTTGLAIFSTPLFWIAMVILYVFGFKLDLFPLTGGQSIDAYDFTFFERVLDLFKHAALPILTMIIGGFAAYQLILRNSMVAVLKEQYIITALAKGLSETRVKHRHAARNALLPFITFLALSFTFMITGSVFIESVFSYPGIGKLIFDSVLRRDYPLLQGCFFIFSVVVITVNFLLDIIYMLLDPRIKY